MTAPLDRPLRFLWFGSYAKGPGYPRSEGLIAGLRELGHEVEEVHEPLFGGAGDRVAAGQGRGLVRAGFRQARASVRLARGWFAAKRHDVAVVGSGGVVDAPLLRFLQNVQRRPVVLDAFIPLYDTVVRDRGLAEPRSARAMAVLGAERLSARVADLVLADTSANAELIAKDLGMDAGRIAIVPVAQPDPGPPAPLPEDSVLRVLLVATHIPLHGVLTVVEAARSLAGAGIEITVVGQGQELPRAQEEAEGVSGLVLVPQFLPPDRIATMLRASHVGLGIFGDTQKAARVVPLKAALTLAHGRALVTRRSPAADEGLTWAGEEAAVLVDPAQPGQLALALAALRDDRARLGRVAATGRRLYEERFTPRGTAQRLVDALAEAGLLSDV